MKHEYWLSKWRTNDIAFHESAINPNLIAYFSRLNLPPSAKILVPLCGKTNDMEWLANVGLHVIGIELSQRACEDFFSERSIIPEISYNHLFIHYQYNNIELFCGDLFDLTNASIRNINAIYDCKALIALPKDSRKKYINHLRSFCDDKAAILLLTRESTCPVKPPPYPIDNEEINFLYGEIFNIALLKSELIEIIPQRLMEKGYMKMKENVYFLSSKK